MHHGSVFCRRRGGGFTTTRGVFHSEWGLDGWEVVWAARGARGAGLAVGEVGACYFRTGDVAQGEDGVTDGEDLAAHSGEVYGVWAECGCPEGPRAGDHGHRGG
jgi:hypothetical protein